MQLRDTDLHVQTSGTGTPFIWAHGMMSSIATEDALGILQWEQFPGNIRLVRYDARGHGASAPAAVPDEYEWPNLGRDLLALADAVDGGAFIAGGLSMGCASAIHAAVLAPQRIKGLVLMQPPKVWEARSAQAALYRRASRLGKLLGDLASGDVNGGLPPWLAAAAPDKASAALHGSRGMTSATLSQLFAAGAVSDLPPPEALAVLAGVPALIIGWVDDPVHPVASAELLHSLLPASELFVAHNYQQAQSIAGRIQSFVSGLAA